MIYETVVRALVWVDNKENHLRAYIKLEQMTIPDGKEDKWGYKEDKQVYTIETGHSLYKDQKWVVTNKHAAVQRFRSEVGRLTLDGYEIRKDKLDEYPNVGQVLVVDH